MLKCPFCESEVADESLRSGRCPVCGGRLAWDEEPEQFADIPPEESPQAPPKGAAGATVPLSGKVPVPPAGEPTVEIPPGTRKPADEEPKPPQHSDNRPTVPAVPSPQASQPTIVLPPPDGPEGGLAGKDIGKTISARDLTADDYRRMTQMWGANFAEPSSHSPQMTVKGEPTVVGKSDSTISRPASVLVIQPRALRKVRDGGKGEADYELLEVIGEGGVGVVYAARQASIDRTVAVKMLRAEITDTADQQEKFLSEAVVTGDLDHPNIVPIYDLGSNESGALFYSMKRVEGTPWIKVLRQKSTAENLEILMKVADAIAFAHARGIVHRDLKPENVMLGDFGEVLVMDWGIALATPSFRKSGSITQSVSMGGTPAYMSPEMVTGPIERIGPSSDIYLLGGLLFEIITGRPPHSGADVMSCLYAAARNEIYPTEESGELIEIAYKAMATDPEDRYETVQAFQAAIREYQSHLESIALSTRAEEDLATAERTGDYQDYARALFAFQESVALWEQNSRGKAGETQARTAYAQRALAKGDFELGLSLLTAKNPAHAKLREELIAAQAERDARQQRLTNAKRLAAALVVITFFVVTFSFFRVKQTSDALASKNTELNTTLGELKESNEAQKRLLGEKEQALAGEREALTKVERQRKVAVDARNAAVTAQNAAIVAKEEQAYEAYVAQIGLAAEKIDDNAYDDARRLLDSYTNSPLKHWEWGRLRYLCRQSVDEVRTKAPVESVVFSPDGSRFATAGHDRRIRFWDSQTRKEVAEPLALGTNVNAIAWSPDGTSIAAACDDRTVAVWNVADGSLRWNSRAHEGAVVHATYSRDGRWLLTSSYDRTARLWDAATGDVLDVLQAHSWWVWGAAFSPNGDRALTVGQDGKCVVWRIGVENGKPRARAEKAITYHRGPVYCAAFSPDGTLVATGGHDHRVLVWNPDEAQPVSIRDRIQGRPDPTPQHVTLSGHEGPVRAVHFSDDAGPLRVLSGGDDNVVRIWDPRTGHVIQALRGHGSQVRSCVFSPAGVFPAGKYVLSGAHDNTAKLWDVSGYREYQVLNARRLRGHDDGILSVAFDPENQRVITSSLDRSARVWNLQTGETDVFAPDVLEEGHDYLVSAAVFFDGGRKLLTAAFDNTARVWDALTGAQLGSMDRTGQSAAASVSKDGAWILTGSDDETARLWRTGDVVSPGAPAEPAQILTGHEDRVTATAISPDATLLFTGDNKGVGIFWDRETGREMRRLVGAKGGPAHTRAITAAHFTPDGLRLVTASADTTVGQWETESGREIAAGLLAHPDAVGALALSRDGREVLTICMVAKGVDRRVPQLAHWNLERAERLRTIDLPDDNVTSVAFSPSGLHAVTAGSNSAVRIWNLKTGDAIRGPDTQKEGDPYLNLSRRGASAWTAAFHPEGNGLLTAGGNNGRLWELTTGVEILNFSPHRAVSTARFSPDGAFIVTGSWDNSAKIWSVSDHRVIVKLAGGHQQPVNATLFSPTDAQLVLTASDDRTARLWRWNRDASPATATVVRTFGGHRGRILAAAFAPDGSRIVTVSSDRTARIWSVEKGDAPLFDPLVHESEVLSVAYSADGKQIVTGSADRTARVWDALTGREIVLPNPLQGHTAGVTSVSFSADGRRILTGSQDGTAKVWDARTGKEILTLRGHTQDVTSVAFASDGPYVVTGSLDGTAILWFSENIAPSLVLDSEPIRYRAGDGVVLLDPKAEVHDPDSDDFEGGVLTVRLAGDVGAGERLFLQSSEPGDCGVSVVDESLQYRASANSPPVTIGSIVSGKSGQTQVHVLLNEDATHDAVCEVLRSIAYEHQSEVPASGRRTVTFAMTDGRGGTSLGTVKEILFQDATLDVDPALELARQREIDQYRRMAAQRAGRGGGTTMTSPAADTSTRIGVLNRRDSR